MSGQINSLSVSTTSGSVTFSDDVHYVVITNTGSNDAYIKIETDTSTSATTNDFPIKSGQTWEFGIMNISKIHAITSSGTTTLLINGASEI